MRADEQESDDEASMAGEEATDDEAQIHRALSESPGTDSLAKFTRRVSLAIHLSRPLFSRLRVWHACCYVRYRRKRYQCLVAVTATTQAKRPQRAPCRWCGNRAVF